MLWAYSYFFYLVVSYCGVLFACTMRSYYYYDNITGALRALFYVKLLGNRERPLKFRSAIRPLCDLQSLKKRHFGDIQRISHILRLLLHMLVLFEFYDIRCNLFFLYDESTNYILYFCSVCARSPFLEGCV